MDHCQVHDGSVKAFLILVPLDVKKAYSYFPSGHHCQNGIFDHANGVMHRLAKMKTQCKEDLYYTVKVAWQMLS